MDTNIKNKIMNDAKIVFLEKGYKETKIIDIAKKAGISPSTIYMYFKGKKELFDALDIPEAEKITPQFEARRSEIVQAALLLFGERGFVGTSMDMIAKETKYSKATLYQYFESKEDLFAVVMKETPFHFNFLSIKPELDKSDTLSAIKKIGIAYMSIFNTPERIAFTRSIIRDSNKHPKISEIYHKNGIGYVSQCVSECLKKEAGQMIPDIDPYLAAQTYVGSLFAFAVQYKVIIGVKQQYSDEEIVNMSAEVLWRGIKK